MRNAVLHAAALQAFAFLIFAASFPALSADVPDASLSVKTELYFGLSKPNGGTVTPSEWSDFLDHTLAPAFKEGLTVVEADGRYADKLGATHSEHSKLLILIHAPRPEMNQAIDAVITQYKERFHQESVLRISSPVTVAGIDSPPPSAQGNPLKEYFAHNGTERLNDPADYIAYLKKSRFKNGELVNLPRVAIVILTA